MQFSCDIRQRLARTGVVAGFSIDHPDDAVPLASALLAGGIDAIELTLRTPAAIESVQAICRDVPDMLVGVGTILSPELVGEVKAAGADFGVAPGLNARVVQAAHECGLPFAPGIATPTELEAAIEQDCRFVKFFPAESLGGVSYLRSMAAPYQHLGIEYFPLGGMNAENMLTYLKEPNVPAIGGSWIVQKEHVQNKDWAIVSARAVEVSSILAEHRALQLESSSSPLWTEGASKLSGVPRGVTE